MKIFGSLYKEVLEIRELMILFKFSQKNFGIIDLTQTDMMLKIITMIKKNREDLKDFIRIISDSSMTIGQKYFAQINPQKLNEFLYDSH